jgi:hypothetical protein
MKVLSLIGALAMIITAGAAVSARLLYVAIQSMGRRSRWMIGAVTFHTARSTAFPRPAPGTAPSPGPLKVPKDPSETRSRWRCSCGQRQVIWRVPSGNHSIQS